MAYHTLYRITTTRILLVDYLVSLANETEIARSLSRMSDNAKFDNYMTYELCVQMKLE